MAQIIAPDDPRLNWQGAVSLQKSQSAVTPWRLPYDDLILYPQPLLERAVMPAGVRLSFLTDATEVAGETIPWLSPGDPEPLPGPSPLDLLVDGELQERAAIARTTGFRFAGLPAREKLVELWLPQFGVFCLLSLALSDGASLRPYEDERPRWITYGSSITHAARAESPSLTWPAIVAREHGLNLTCLGYGGQCHLDPMVARMIRDLPADFISIKVGINIKGGATLNERTFRSGITGFVQIVREKHPDAPFAVISPIYAPPHEEMENAVGFNLRKMRQEVQAAVDALVSHGDRNVHYIDGLEILGPGDEEYLTEDGVHPSADGYKLMGQRFLEKVARKVFV